MSLGLGIASAISGGGSAAVVIEDYLWSSVAEGEITPRFAAMNAANVVDNNDAWDITGADLMPSVDSHPNYFSDDEGYWVVTEASNAVMTDGEDMTAGQDGDADTQLTPIAVANIPIGDGNYV